MSLTLVYKQGQDEVPGLEVLRRMRDLMVSGLRTELLSGMFIGNPDDLEVYGEVRTNKIKIVVVDSKKKSEFTRSLSFDDFSRGAGEPPAPGAGHKDDVVNRPTDTGRGDGPDTVVEDNPLMPRVALSRRISEDQFLNRHSADDLRVAVSARVRTIARDYVKEFLAVKTERNRGR